MTPHVVPAAMAGALLGSLLACVPGLHVYNALALAVALLARHALPVPPAFAVPFVCGMIAAYSLLNTLPSILAAAPDESAFFTVLPGQKLLAQGRGYEACLLTALGGMGALLALVFLIGPWAPRWLPVVRHVFRPHGHWILWSVVAFMLLSEWPKPMGMRPTGWRARARAWRSPGFGLLTFLLSGWLGFIAIYRSPVPAAMAFQNLMPAFAGLFTLPWLIMNLVSRVRMPRQSVRTDAVPWHSVLTGAGAGLLGGGFAAFFPVVTAGVGGLLAGHATSLRDDRAFLVSQGAAKTMYMAGAMLLLFAPGVGLVRGGAAWMTQSLVAAGTQREYGMALAALAIGGATALLLFGPLARLWIVLLQRLGVRRLSWGSLAMVVGLVFALTGGGGLILMLTGLGIGLIPVLFGARRMNGLGVVMLPIACIMSGHGPTVARWLGLL